MESMLDPVEEALVNACNEFEGIDNVKNLRRYGELSQAIDEALRIVQSMKEEDESRG